MYYKSLKTHPKFRELSFFSPKIDPKIRIIWSKKGPFLAARPQHMICKSSNVICCVTCKKCNGQYIGETEQELHRRSSGHLSEIRHNRPGLPYVSHFRNCGIEFYSITGVEKIRKNDIRIRKQREIFYKKLFKVSTK